MESTMILKQLPGDLLDLILGNLAYSHLVVPLWICGDSIFNAKLASNIRQAHLRSTWPLRTGFPTVLLKLRTLRHLSVEVPFTLMPNPLEWPIAVQQFPETLESLSIVCADSHLSFRNFAPSSTPTHKIYITTQYQHGKSRLIDIGRRLPRLRTLTLKGGKSLQFDDLAALPDSLTFLGVESIDYLGRHMDMLPRSLVKLQTTVTAASDVLDSWSAAPPHLESISSLRTIGELPDYSWLPMDLLKLVIDNSTFPFNPKLARSLPSSLRTIAFQGSAMDSFEQNGQNWASFLPKDLTALIFRLNLSGRFILNTNASISVGLAELAFLPKSLTKISLDRDTQFDWASISDEGQNLEKWLPHLKSLKSTVPHHMLHLLPPSLRHLEVFITYNGQKQILCFPPLLTSLFIASAKCPLGFLENSFPPTLTEFNMPPNDSETCLRSLVFNSLPPSLTNFDAGLRAPFEKPLRFPPNMTRFKVNRWSFDWFHLFPATLIYLNISWVGNLSILAERNYFETLPTSLTYLRLERSRTYDEGSLSNCSFSHLPHLVSLNVKEFGIFESSILRTLPPNLEQLEMTLNGIASEDAPFIPPYLSIFNLNFPQINLNDPHVIDHWPLGAVLRATYTPLPLNLLDKVQPRVNAYYATQVSKREHLLQHDRTIVH